MRARVLLTLLLVLALAAPVRAGGKDDRLFQASVLPALLAGDYAGSFGAGEILAKGNFGLGTFENLDGEMVVLDGVIWQVPASGQVRRMDAAAKSPFACVAFFEPDLRLPVASAANLEDLDRQLDAALPGLNRFYALRLDGRMRVKARSVPRQDKPWRPLAEVVKEQSVFDLGELEGTLVGLRCPAFAASLNVSGYHWHFLSKDRTRGGHVLDCSFTNLSVAVDRLSSLELRLPKAAAFDGLDLSGDRSAQVKAVEKSPEAKK